MGIPVNLEQGYEILDYNKIHFHPDSEKLVEILMEVCDNEDPEFFRVVVAHHMAKAAGAMRAEIMLHSTDTLPINCFSIALAPSGAGKGKSLGFISKKVFKLFEERFRTETMRYIGMENIAKLASKRAQINGTDEDDERAKIEKEAMKSGAWIPACDSATTAALKQFRHKLQTLGIGAFNLEIDEVGDNLTESRPVLSKMLELYDTGEIKESLTKNTDDNTRLTYIGDATPTNALLFGTPASLLNGSKTEDEFYGMLEKGWGRRAIFAFSKNIKRSEGLTARQIFEQRNSRDTAATVDEIATKFMNLADETNYRRKFSMEENEEILYIEYQLWCKERATKVDEWNQIQKNELENRHIRVLKLAASYAFYEGATHIEETHLYNAIALVEDSGKQLDALLYREPSYQKLARWLGQNEIPVTQAEMNEALPFYRGTKQARDEMLSLAMAYGYKNNIVIKKSFVGGIDMYRGETMKNTDLEKLTIATSQHVAYNYTNASIKWEDLAMLGSTAGYHWVNHHTVDGNRNDDAMKTGFELVVIDCDGGISLAAANDLLKDYKFMTYTTKRHGEDGQDRFRLVIPMKYRLELDGQDYREFMKNIFEWLPFKVDDGTGQRSKKWLTNDGLSNFNEGELFDPLPFIPSTQRNEERKKALVDLKNLGNLERWFIQKTGEGNRSNQLVKYALLLVDGGASYPEVEKAVIALNSKIQDPLPEEELQATVLVTARKRITEAE